MEFGVLEDCIIAPRSAIILFMKVDNSGGVDFRLNTVGIAVLD